MYPHRCWRLVKALCARVAIQRGAQCLSTSLPVTGVKRPKILERGPAGAVSKVSDEPPPQTPKLLKSLSDDPELESSLVGPTTVMKLRMAAIREELGYLISKDFPLPDTLTRDQWQRLLSLTDKEIRVRYLDAVVQEVEEEAFESLKETDKTISQRFVFTEQMFSNLVEMEPDMLRERVATIQQTYDELFQLGELLPYIFRDEHLHELIETNSWTKLQRSLSFLGHLRIARLNNLIDRRVRIAKGKEIKARVLEQRAQNKHLTYGLGHNTILLRTFQSKIRTLGEWYEAREFHSWGQPLVIDLAFVKHLSVKEMKSLAFKEISFALLYNRQAKVPLPIYLCNFNPKCPKCRILLKAIPNFGPSVCTEKSYLDLFPKENLLYLSPDSTNDLNEIDGSEVFLIGGLVDKTSESHDNYTLTAAKKHGIRHARLPLRQHIGYVFLFPAHFLYTFFLFLLLDWAVN